MHWGRNREREIAREIRAHLDAEAEEQRAAGLAADAGSVLAKLLFDVPRLDPLSYAIGCALLLAAVSSAIQSCIRR